MRGVKLIIYIFYFLTMLFICFKDTFPDQEASSQWTHHPQQQHTANSAPCRHPSCLEYPFYQGS